MQISSCVHDKLFERDNLNFYLHPYDEYYIDLTAQSWSVDFIALVFFLQCN